MTKSRTLKRLGSLVPDVDTIALAYGVDQKRAKKIRAGMGTILELFGDIIAEQAEFIEGQADTAKMIDRKLGRERDAGMMLADTEQFLTGDPATAKYILKKVFTDFFANEFEKLELEERVELFSALSKAINCLKNKDQNNNE